MRWPPLVAILLMGGCLGGGTDGGDDAGGPQTPTPGPTPPAQPPPTHTAMLMAFDYADCTGVMAHPTVPLAEAQGVLPDGYVAWQGEGVQEVGVAQYMWVECATFSTSTATVNDTVYGHVAVRIQAPANATEADEHWYRLRMLTKPDVLEAVWKAAAYDVYSAGFNASSSVPAPLPAAEQTIALGDYWVQALAGAQADGLTGTRAYYTDVDAGRLEWTGSVDLATTTGAGRLHAPSDDPLAGAWPEAQEVWLVTGGFAGNDLWLRRAA